MFYRAATGVLINIDQKQKLQNIDQNICNIDHTALYRPITDHKRINTLWWWTLTGTTSQSSTSRALTWIQCKLGKQYLLKKFTLPWESNPGPTPIRGGPVTIIASVGLKKLVAIRHYIYPKYPLYISKIY